MGSFAILLVSSFVSSFVSSSNLPGDFLIVFLNKWYGEGGRQDPELSEVIFLLFFFINGNGKGGGRILSSPR